MTEMARIHPPSTTAEFHRMARRGAFKDMRVELRRGMLAKKPPKFIPHSLVDSDLTFAIQLAVRAAMSSWRVGTGASVSFGEGFDPMADIVVYDATMPAHAMGTIDPQAVKLIVEVADSSLEDDMGEKRDDYARFGLVEYWVADVNAKIAHMHAAPVNGVFTKVTQAKLGDALAMLTQPQIVAQIS